MFALIFLLIASPPFQRVNSRRAAKALRQVRLNFFQFFACIFGNCIIFTVGIEIVRSRQGR